MENILFGTHTDYIHFNLSDIAEYFENLSITTENCVNEIKIDIESLPDNYWEKNVYFNFRVQIENCVKIYQTVYKDLREIKNEILDEVMPHHYSRILRFAINADEINRNLGEIWGNEYDDKDYDNKNFLVVERIYQDSRDMSEILVDLGNIVNRLNDFMGTINNKNEKSMSQIFNIETLNSTNTILGSPNSSINTSHNGTSEEIISTLNNLIESIRHNQDMELIFKGKLVDTYTELLSAIQKSKDSQLPIYDNLLSIATNFISLIGNRQS